MAAKNPKKTGQVVLEKRRAKRAKRAAKTQALRKAERLRAA